ncbi:hypothetical protein TrLO_g2270 [Triparma laevis f. longispina]|uniref:RING-type domain-containing protein n=1 Tax=Triparma laevis f. longispina TaxID=1714387 RepID=A0A9W7F8I9_9STRA|nr:hypothetical protein TrLO_g2270 [Triparma laevis f. longispina]
MDKSTPRTRNAIKNVAKTNADSILSEGLKRSRKTPTKSPRRPLAEAKSNTPIKASAGSKFEPIEIPNSSYDSEDEMYIDEAKDPNPSPSKKQRAAKSLSPPPPVSSSSSSAKPSMKAEPKHPYPRLFTISSKFSETPSLTVLVTLVTDVFPDASPAAVKKLLQRFRCTEEHHLPTVLTHMLSEGYEKVIMKGHEADEALTRGLGLEKKYSRDFTSTSWTTNENYRSQAVKKLLNDFAFLAVDGLEDVFKRLGKGHYYALHDKICCAVLGDEEKENEEFSLGALSDALVNGKLEKAGNKRLKGLGLNLLRKPRRRKAHPDHVFTELILLEEIEFVEERLRERQVDMDEVVGRRMARNKAEERGELLECECCFDDVCFEEMCQCTSGHLFCLSCLRRYAEEKLFGQQSTTLCCMAQTESGEKCPGTFSDMQLERALPKKVMRKLQEAIYEAAVEEAGLCNIAKCPICDFTAMCDDRVFRCPAVGCGYESCRECGEPPHFPLKCSEVEKTSHAESRKKIEEAMTQARVRECPDCGKRFFKTEGCNKMSCSCGGLSCYCCREKLERTVGYKHFCQVSNCDHSTCGRCPLFSDSVEDDRRAMREAGLKAMAENESELLRGAKKDIANGEEVKSVDVDTLLESKPVNSEAAKRAAVMAQQNAHLGVGAMARVAYQEIDMAGRRGGGLQQQQEQPGAGGFMVRMFGGVGGGGR